MMHAVKSGRRCRRCSDPIQWSHVRLVGSRTFCSESCAIIWLSEEAGRAAWQRAVLEMDRRARGPRHRAKVALGRREAVLAQRRLDRRLQAGPRAEWLPWVWIPARGPALALVLVLLLWGAVGAFAPAPPAPAAPETAALTPGPSAPAEHLAPAGRPAAQGEPAAAPPAASPTPTPRPAGRPLPSVPAPPPVESSVTSADILRGSTTAREIAFTFDGGDAANVAGEILDILWARRIQTTLFLTGQFIRLYPDLVRRMVAEGHEIGNHTDSHPRLTTYAETRRQQTRPGVTREFVTTQLRRAEQAFHALTGQPMAPFWRAPYGEHNAEIRAWAAEAGYRHIAWTRGAGTAEDLDTRDWVADRSSRIYRTREEIAARIIDFGKGRPEGLNGGIVLMHLATHRKTDRPHEGLPELLKTLQAQGYRLVTISELLGHAEAPPKE
jgi:peptidoglycan/xylan/chitin deacetylase (PgdA/CDA1 family)